MKALVFLEHHGGELTKGPLGVLAKAAALGDGEVAAVLIGSGSLAAAASQAGKFGATTVHVAEHDALDLPLPQPRVDVLADVVRAGDYDTVLFSNSVLAADIAAALAARLDAGLNWDLVDIAQQNGELIGKRPALQDSVLVDVGWRSPHRIALFRSGSFEAATTGGEPRIDNVAVQLQEHSHGAKIVSQNHREDKGPSLEDAEVIVAGGIGLGSAESFAARGGARRTARWRRRGNPRRGLQRLVSALVAGRPDRQDGDTEALRRVGYLGRRATQSRYAELEGDHRRSTRTRPRRSSNSATSPSSATYTPSSRRSSNSCGNGSNSP